MQRKKKTMLRNPMSTALALCLVTLAALPAAAQMTEAPTPTSVVPAPMAGNPGDRETRAQELKTRRVALQALIIERERKLRDLTQQYLPTNRIVQDAKQELEDFKK